MNVLKTALDVLLIALGLAVMSDATVYMLEIKDLAVKEAHPHKYVSLRKWTEALTK